jgi:hypothetical protein
MPPVALAFAQLLSAAIAGAAAESKKNGWNHVFAVSMAAAEILLHLRRRILLAMPPYE